MRNIAFVKAMFFCALLAFGFLAIAQNPDAVSKSQAEAVREFPALAQQGSDFNKQFVGRYKALKTIGDATLTHDDWPLVLAKQIGTELGVAPAAPTPAPPVASPTPAAAESPKANATGNLPNVPKAIAAATTDNPFVNSLGMKFVPVPGTKVLFSIWDTRVQDYRAYAEANPGVNPAWKKPGYPQQQDHPVVEITWPEANSFCKWLTDKEKADGTIGKNEEYRLPTDAEWSTAAGPTKYPWGDELPPPRTAGNYHPATEGNRFKNTSPVGSFDPNQFGLYDMGGNAWQWVQDWYREDMNDPALLTKFPFLKLNGDGHSAHVIRGNSYYRSDPEMLATSVHASDPAENRTSANSFRCVLAPIDNSMGNQ